MQKQTDIKYVNGDATAPLGLGEKFVVHCCNDIGGWGAGFVLAISKKWKAPEHMYRAWYETKICNGQPFALGSFQIVAVDKEQKIAVVNLIGQEGIGFKNGPPIRYEAIRQGCSGLVDAIVKSKFPNPSIHCPRFGAGLAGGDWNKIEAIIKETFCVAGIPVTVYDYQPK
jgi:O-acetyl-ADP-ribose deacetylase (regulator of RNase III)